MASALAEAPASHRVQETPQGRLGGSTARRSRQIPPDNSARNQARRRSCVVSRARRGARAKLGRCRPDGRRRAARMSYGRAEEVSMRLRVPTFADVLEARRRIGLYLRPTALHSYPALDRLLGAEVWVKHENHQPIGAFKVRGGINLVSRLDDGERARGVITASTGNHGQSIAYASRLFGVRAIVCVPEGANPVKVESMRALGAEIVVAGEDFDTAREHCERLAASEGYRYVHSGNEPLLIAGVATETLEIVEARPDLDTLIVPVGAGRGGAGGVPVVGGPVAGARPNGDLCGGLGHADRVRAAAAGPVGASGRLRAGRGARAARGDLPDDRADPQSGRAGRRGGPRRRAAAATAAGRQACGGGRQRRQHQAPPSSSRS